MLENIRNHAQSWLAKIILGGVALSFVLWGIGDYFLGSRVQAIATVDGEPISDSSFYQAYERQLNAYRALLGKRFSKKLVEAMGIKQVTLQTMINRRLILAEAEEMGLTAPESALLARVRANPAFQSAGRFDPRRYEILTRNMGYRTPADYEASLRLDLIADALRRTIMDSAMVSDADIRSHYAREYERRELAALLVDPGALEKKVNIDAKKARAYYAAHKERYRSPLRLKLAAVVIDPAKLAREIEVGEDEIRAAYKERRDQFSVPETRRAAHIFVSLDANAGAAAVKKARAKIEKALKMLKSGRPFAVVAKALSEDAATAARGGDLGFFKQGTLDPKLDRTVFGMKKGQLSDIIRTRNGFHILKLTDVRPPRLRSLAEVRGQLLEKLRRRKAEDEAYKLSQDLDDALGREDSLKAAASSLNLKVREIGPISREEALADPLLGRDVEFRNRVFTLEPGAPVEVMELGDGRYAAVEVEARIQPQVLPYAKVVQRVIKDARVEAARERARKLAESLLREAKNAGMPAMAKAHGLPLYLSKPVRRRGAGDDKAAWLTPAVLKAAFSTPAGAVVPEVIATPQGFVVVKVRRVIKAEESGFSKHEKDIRSELERSRGGIRFARWMAAVRARHEIQIHPDVLARF